jgi:hypothetical protein
MVLGSQYPLAELISLRDFGRNIARTEPPSMLFHWSNDSETVSHATFQITMNNFRKLADHFITQAEALCDQLMFGVRPHVDLSKIKDDISSSESGYSFISCPTQECRPEVRRISASPPINVPAPRIHFCRTRRVSVEQ